MNSNRLRLWSPLPPDECLSRLSAAFDHEVFTLSTLGPARLKPVIGRIDGSKFRLRKRISYRNSFQTFLSAEMLPESSGTVIFGVFGMGRFVQIFSGCWLAFAALTGGMLFLGTLGDLLSGSALHASHGWTGLFEPLLMPAFGVGLVGFGRYLARDEKPFITEFLVRILDAEDQRQPAKIDLAP